MNEDNRNIIRLEELEEGKKKYLSDNELKSKLESYKGRVPAVILNDIYELLKGKRITEDQLEKIVSRIESKLKERSEADIGGLVEKLDRLEKALSTFMKKVEESFGEIAKRKLEEVYSEQEIEEVQESETPVGKSEERVAEKETEARSSVAEKFELPVDIEEVPKRAVRLSSIPKTTKAMMFLLKWIEFMIERVGYDGLSDLLDYYVDIGWISEDVMFDVMKYAKGIKLYHEKSDWRPVGYMNVQDHLMSLLFIEALRTGKMNKELLFEVERQVYRIKKEVSEIDGI